MFVQEREKNGRVLCCDSNCYCVIHVKIFTKLWGSNWRLTCFLCFGNFSILSCYFSVPRQDYLGICYLHVRMVRVREAGGRLCVRVAGRRHASQVAGLRTEGITSSGTLHHRTSALELGADHQLRQNMSQKFSSSSSDLNAGR